MSVSSRPVLLLLIILFNWDCNRSSLPVYSPQAFKLISALEPWYQTDRPDMGVWETTSWWNTANIVNAMIRYYSRAKDENTLQLISDIYEVTDSFEVPAYGDRAAWICQDFCNAWYDDEGWWINTWLEAYEVTGDLKYLEVSKIIFNDLVEGWTTDCEGGILWKKGYTNKASISNSLTLMAASRLAGHVNNIGNEPDYAAWAKRIWQWIDSKKLIVDGLVIDGINADNCQTNTHIWTYNQGAMIGALVAYHILTEDQKYLQQAHVLAQRGIEYFSNSQGILTESCEPDDCTGDNCQFKGIFMRNLTTLYHADPQTVYRNFILRNADRIWNSARNPDTDLVGISWSRPSNATACTQGSAIDALVAAMLVE